MLRKIFRKLSQTVYSHELFPGVSSIVQRLARSSGLNASLQGGVERAGRTTRGRVRLCLESGPEHTAGEGVRGGLISQEEKRSALRVTAPSPKAQSQRIRFVHSY